VKDAGAPDGKGPNVCVFAPALLLTVTIEPIEGSDDPVGEVHLHPGGQGFWIARMLEQLGERPVLCAPVGGETGRALWGLMTDWGIDLRPIVIDGDSAARIHDRRSGERDEIAQTVPAALDRHELDDLYAKVLELALETRTCVVTGRMPGDGLGDQVFTRLGADLANMRVRTVADLHGRDLDAWLKGGPIDVLKVSDEDLAADGALDSDTEDAVFEVMVDLIAKGARSVVVSRAHRPALALISRTLYRVHPPNVSVVDSSGAGDSMTGALAAGFLNSMEPTDALRLACAAGSANVARHGLATGSADLIRRLADEVEIEMVRKV
jgi:1-phosphofructokinase